MNINYYDTQITLTKIEFDFTF